MSKKSKSKYYVVWVGMKPGIYKTWDECKAQIFGFPNAKYRSYKTLTDAKEALAKGYTPPLKNNKKTGTISNIELQKIIQKNSISVDAACSGNPGIMEYRGVYTNSKEEIFRMGPFKDGTNNIGEFLALVHGLAWLYKRSDNKTVIYSDSRTAMAWVRNEKVKTSLKINSANKPIFELVDRALNWLKTHNFETRIIKWQTEKWGEIPADFGRK